MLAFADYREVGTALGGAGAVDTSLPTCQCLTGLRHRSGQHQLLLEFFLGSNGRADIGQHCIASD